MKILNIENAVKFELDEMLLEKFEMMAAQLKITVAEDELIINDGTMKEKALTIYRMILATASETREALSFEKSGLNEDFRMTVLPKLMMLPTLLVRLADGELAEQAYGELIGSLKSVLDFRQKTLVVTQYNVHIHTPSFT